MKTKAIVIRFLVVMIALIGFLSTAATASFAATWHINPSTGSDTNAGTSTQPLKTINAGFSKAQPGDTIQLQAGEYRQDVQTVRAGTAAAPIKVVGPREAVIKGAGNARIFQIFHEYIQVDGFTMDGRHATGDSADSFRDKLMYVHGGQSFIGITGAPGSKQYLNGLKITNMLFKNAAGECLRLRYYIKGAEIAHNTFENCGVLDFTYDGGGKNGEAIYVGTSSNQWADGKNPESGPDKTTEVWIHHNTFNTKGNECIEFKEGAFNNVAEYNDCQGNKDVEASGMGSRGSENIFRYNTIHHNVGAGIRVGGHEVNGVIYGINNKMYGNIIYANGNGGIKLMTQPQIVCENDFSQGQTNPTTGSYATQYASAVSANCPAGVKPTSTPAPSSTPTPTLSPTPAPTATPCPLSADFTGDCKVNILDYSILVNHFFRQQGDSNFDPNIDIQPNGKIDLLDYSMLVNQYSVL